MTGNEVITSTGAVRGARRDGITAFHGVPYAAAPSGDARFRPPQPVVPWPGVRDATAPGPIAPQPASRLERVMGPLRPDAPQSEDCLSLDVWTPGPGGSPRPVMVWVHGGGFSSGSGSAEWYDGAGLAAAGDMVVVTVNYRLAALGFLYLAGFDEQLGSGNLGLLDMVAALRWVRENIAAFGGDPEQVTLAGQSAGALSTLTLMAGSAATLFQRAILQSGPFGLPPTPLAEAHQAAEQLLAALDLRPDQVHALRAVPVADVLAAQGAVAVAAARPLSMAPPFQLVADGELVASDPAGLVGAGAGAGIEVLMGFTRDESAAFLAGAPQADGMTREAVLDAVRPWFGDGAEEQYARHEPGLPPQIASTLSDEHYFGVNDRLAADRAASGGTVYAYRFDWRPAGSPFGACHCLELPFVFGNPAAWREAPMLAGSCPAQLVAAVQQSWISFVRTGDPNHGGGTGWQQYHGPGTVRHLDVDG